MKFTYGNAIEQIKQETFDSLTDEEINSLSVWIEMKEKNQGRYGMTREGVLNDTQTANTTPPALKTADISPLVLVTRSPDPSSESSPLIDLSNR